MTAAERLNAMLDERGIEHGRCGNTVAVKANGLLWHVRYSGVGDYEGLHADCITPMTPEQAIAATVGDVVRCKDCENYEQDSYGIGGVCHFFNRGMASNDWCSRAVRSQQ